MAKPTTANITISGVPRPMNATGRNEQPISARSKSVSFRRHNGNDHRAGTIDLNIKKHAQVRLRVHRIVTPRCSRKSSLRSHRSTSGVRTVLIGELGYRGHKFQLSSAASRDAKLEPWEKRKLNQSVH